jgi:hypothetical protein
MAKPPPPGKCIHCLNDFEQLTWDHVFPESWYPETTEDNLEKWKIPSCAPCNEEFGRIEEDLLIKLGLCLDPKEYKSSGIVQKVLRSLNPRYGKNERDKQIRQAKRSKILKKALFGNNIPKEGRYPGFEKQLGNSKTKEMAVLINPDYIRKLAEKIVRGITYIDRNEFIEDPYIIDFAALREEGNDDIHELLNKHGTITERQPGIYIKKAVAEDDKMSSIFYIEIWGRFKMYAYVTNKNYD